MSDAGQSDQTLIDALQRHLRTTPDAIAYWWAGRTWTFQELERDSNRIANALSKEGIGKGDRVAALTKHHVPCLLLMLACMKVGAVCMPVNWRLAPPEVEYIIDHGQARLLIVDEAFAAPFLRGGAANLPACCAVLCTEKTLDDVLAFEDWYAEQSEEFQAITLHPYDSAVQIYSSGTTGTPKGIVLTHRGLLSTSREVSRDWHFGADNVLGNPLPTFHVAGITMLLLTLYTGGKTVAYSDFDPAVFIDGIAEQRVTHAFLVPAMLIFLLQSPAAAKGNFSSLKLIAYGGSPISETVLQQSMKTFGCDFLQVYGLTEVSGPATFLSQEDHRRASQMPELLRSAGRPIGNCRIRIVEPVSGQDLPEGQTGEVWLESERNFKEYWRAPEATERAFPEGRNERGGWFRTGDAGYLKNDYLYINDRIKDMVISGGENIYPAEIENLLMKHPKVADCAIIGVPDATWGESVKACVVLKPGVTATEGEIIEWMREHLARYKCPKSIDFLDTLPRNPSGKLLKRILREPYWKDLQRAVG